MFPGVGTLVNVITLIFGGICGLFVGRFLKERIQTTVIKALGLATITMGAATSISQILSVSIVQTNGNYLAHIDTKGSV